MEWIKEHLIISGLIGTLLVLNKSDDTVSFIDLKSIEIRATLPTGDGPHFSGGTIGMAATVRALADGGRDDVLWDLLHVTHGRIHHLEEDLAVHDDWQTKSH